MLELLLARLVRVHIEEGPISVTLRLRNVLHREKNRHERESSVVLDDPSETAQAGRELGVNPRVDSEDSEPPRAN